MDVVRTVGAWLVVGLGLGGFSFACRPSAAPVTPAPSADAFAVVRATSQAAYTSGKAHLDRGEYLQACVDLDAARTTDPDDRPDIQQALQSALQYCLTPLPEATAAQSPPQQRTVVVATVQAAAFATPKPGNVPALKPTGAPAVSIGTTQSAPAATVTPPAASNTSSAGLRLVQWNDPQGRFSIGFPADWSQSQPPRALFATAVVQIHDPSGRAEVDVAVDPNTKAVSPELYAATLELAMQQQVPGYASEEVVPGATAGNPSLRRTFTFTQRDAAGQDHQARGFQLTIVKGSTPYIVSGSSPAEQFQGFSPSFDGIVESFRFS
jgi:hypothetical protein